MKKLCGICALIMAVGFSVNCASAKGQPAKERSRDRNHREYMDEETKAFYEAQQALREAHYKEQAEQNKAFQESIKDKTPVEKCIALKEHRTTQFQENQAFHKELFQKRLAFITARAEANYQKMSDLAQTRHVEFIAVLDKLAAKSDLTNQDIAQALKDFYQAEQKERDKWKEHHRNGNPNKEKKDS